MSAGALLLVAPAVYSFGKFPAHKQVYAAFGIGWIGVIAAAALGNDPTPLVGYGGSAVLGYVLSLAAIGPAAEPRRAAEQSSEVRPHERKPVRGSLRAAWLSNST